MISTWIKGGVQVLSQGGKINVLTERMINELVANLDSIMLGASGSVTSTWVCLSDTSHGLSESNQSV